MLKKGDCFVDNTGETFVVLDVQDELVTALINQQVYVFKKKEISEKIGIVLASKELYKCSEANK
jgi:hypothetical protein